MKNYLTYKDDKSHKFWQIEVTGESFTIAYGKIGTAGTNQTKKFESVEKCLTEADKLLKEKLKKGYKEEPSEIQSIKKASKDTTTSETYLEKWKALTKAKNLSKSLASHFSFLAETPYCEKIVNDFFKKADRAEIVNDTLQITFLLENEDGDNSISVLICEKPYLGKVHSYVPYSLGEIAKHHNGITWEGDDVPFVFNGIDENGVSNSSPENLITSDAGFTAALKQKGLDVSMVVAPITDRQNWYIFNPLINSQQEPALCQVLHDDGLVMAPLTLEWNFRGSLLRLLATFALGQVSWSSSIPKATSINFTLAYQVKRYIKKAIVHQDKLVTIQTKLREDLLPYYPGAGKQIAIYDLKTGRDISSLMLDESPYDVVVHENILYLFCVGISKPEIKFQVKMYSISDSGAISFLNTLYETTVKEPYYKKCGWKDVADKSTLLIHDNKLLFFFAAYSSRELKGHEIRVYDLANKNHLFIYTFPDTFVSTPIIMDHELICIASSEINVLIISENKIKREPWFKLDCRNIFCAINNHVYAQINYKIVVFNKQEKQLFIYENPTTMGIEYMYGSGNTLLVDTGFFYEVQSDGQLALIKTNLKPKVVSDHYEQPLFTGKHLMIQREFQSAKPEKEILFEVYIIEN
jgi:predicted DNA-binding WGR domain protein